MREGEQGVVGDDVGVVGEVGVADGGADGCALRGGVDLVEADVVYVDEGGGQFYAVLHEVDEIGAAAEELGVVRFAGVDGGFGGVGAVVGEGDQAVAPWV